MGTRYGAGTAYQRSRDGKWVVAWEAPRVDGKRRRRSVVGDTEAQAWARMYEVRSAEARSSSSSRQATAGETVGEFLDRWLSDVIAPTRRERTLWGYRAIVEALRPAIGSIRLAKLTTRDVQRAIAGRDLAPQTIRHYAACLRGAFTYAVRHGLMERNPAADLVLPAVRQADRVPWTSAELRAFLAAIPEDDELAPLWITAAWTGMRQGELLGLRWQDVDLDRGSLVVRRSLARLPGPTGTRYVLEEPKTERSRRTIPLTPATVAALRELRKRQLSAPRKLDQGLVFATPAGSPLDAARVSIRFRRAVETAGLRLIRFHDLRHTAASLMIEAGIDLATISRILGHSTIATTADIYGHLTESGKRAAIDRFAEVVG